MRRLRLFCCSLLLALASCASPSQTSGPTNVAPKQTTTPWSQEPVVSTLHLVHMSDTEAGMLASDTGTGGTARAAAIIKALTTRAGHSLVVHAGDTFIPAPELSLELRWPIDNPSRAPALVTANNALGLQVAAVGNHDLDLGEGFLADVIKRSTFPYMASTLSVTGGALSDVLDDSTPWLGQPGVAGKLIRRARACVGTLAGDVCNGLTVGVVSAVPESLRILSTGAKTVSAPATVQETLKVLGPQLAELQRLGVRHTVLLSHRQGVDNDIALIEAGLVSVDVIVSAGGENRLVPAHGRLQPGTLRDPICAREPLGCYPVWRRAKDGAPIAIVATDGGLNTIGAVSFGFDAKGHLTAVDGKQHPWLIDEESLLELRAEPDRALTALELATRDALAPLMAPLGTVDVYLEGAREKVRNVETNLGSLSADALLMAVRKEQPGVVAAFRNGGAIRDSIGVITKDGARHGKQVTMLDIKGALRFDNPVVVVDVSHAALARCVEASLIGVGTGQGRFLHVSSGVRVRYAANGADQQQLISGGRAAGVKRDGTRLRELTIETDTGTVTIVKDGVVFAKDAVVRIATIDYLRNGGDGWFPDGAPQALATLSTEQQAFAELVKDADLVKSSLAVTGRIVRVP